MKFSLIFIIIVVVNSQRLFSQSNNFTITINNINTEYSCLFNDNDTIHIVGSGLPYIQEGFKYLHSIYYPSKYFIHTLNFCDSFKDYYARSINLIKSNNNYVSAIWTGFKDTSNKAIIVTDRLGKLTKKIEKGVPNTKGGVYFQNIYNQSENNFIVNAYIDYRKAVYPYYNYLIYKLDSNFNTVDSVFVDSFNYLKKYDIKPSGLAPNGVNRFRIIINNFKFNCDYNLSFYDAQLVDVDSSLKIIKSKNIPNRKLNIANSLYIDKNKTLIYGEKLDTNLCLPGFQFGLGRPYIAMIDSNINIIWEIHYDNDTGARMAYKIDRALNNVIQLKDGNFIAVGSYYYPIKGYQPNSNNINPWGGLVIKFDIKGNEIWSKRLRYDDFDSICPESYFSIRDVTELKNGDLFAIGALSHDCLIRDTTISSQRGWIMKLDKNGNILKNNITASNPKNEIQLYPNPTSNKLILDNLNQNIQYYYEIFQLDGKKVLSNSIQNQSKILDIDILNLKNGNYILQIFDNNSSIVYSNKFTKN